MGAEPQRHHGRPLIRRASSPGVARLAASLLAGAALFGTPSAARAQMDSREGIALQNQILELRRDLDDLQQRRGGLPPPTRIAPQGPGYGGGGGGEIAAQLVDRVARLEDDVRRLRGQMDELANQTRRQADELNKQLEDMAFRLQSPPSGGGASGAPGQPRTRLAPPPPDDRQFDPDGGDAPRSPRDDERRPPSGRRPPELAMQEGNAALARRDYPAAEAAAREVLTAGRSTPRSGDAQFLLAQALAGKRDFQAAAIAYDDAYNRARTGSHAADSLLGLGNALGALGERPAACATLDKLRAEFSSPSAAFREATNAARTRSGCR